AQAKIELEAFKAGSEIYIDGVIFPIAGPYSVPLINSFGFPRMPGTPDAHSHQGIDIFAPRGTPLVAAERGVIGRVGNGRLGGLKFWLRGESGADWYYAHLDGFAPGLHNGQVVEAGELLGYVGNTGNAVGTPPHLHLEIHPGGGAAVNPYPLLKVVSDLDLKTFEEGRHPGFRYQPVVRNRPEATTSESSTTSQAPSTEATTNSGAGTTAPPAPSSTTSSTALALNNSTQSTASTAPSTSPTSTVATTAPTTTDDGSVAGS
ncbi:MAG: peptidoglycan DD-metalloendopeptidase family protein, partial [Acidimicrobiia bacterium]|nr:peptidoglycan DD-metalloendopeptidase family protein [Acidimicrobiia bacterium]